MPKTDGTFIAPNENFLAFTQNLSQKSSEEQTSKRKTQSNDRFVDFIVKQYKSDGFICTLDENERQIYYCYYCHQYVNDLDLIETHIDTSKHLNVNHLFDYLLN